MLPIGGPAAWRIIFKRTGLLIQILFLEVPDERASLILTQSIQSSLFFRSGFRDQLHGNSLHE